MYKNQTVYPPPTVYFTETDSNRSYTICVSDYRRGAGVSFGDHDYNVFGATLTVHQVGNSLSRSAETSYRHDVKHFNDTTIRYINIGRY